MKTLMMLNFMMLMTLNMNLLFIMNYFYLNIFKSPLKQLFYLIFYIIYMSMNLLFIKQMISLNLFMLMIIFISGILIIFSYFVCLLNKSYIKTKSLKNSFFNTLMFLILIYIQINQIMFFMKTFNFNYKKNYKINIISKLYMTPNYSMLLIIIFFLLIMLLLTTKICYIKNKNLRSMKWKKK
nr:TPA_asm: ND6 [Bombus haemorrhoidalis]